MKKMSEKNGAPDSWETEADCDNSLDAALQKLNVNAPVFIPNVNAPAFVPSFLKETPEPPSLVPDPPPESTDIEEAKLNSQNEEINSTTNSWSKAASNSLDDKSPTTEKINNKIAHAKQNASIPVDSWEDAANTPSPTQQTPSPDDDEESSESDSLAKPKIKKVLTGDEEEYKKEPVNVIFIGHVDAGKSTIGGQIMYLTGMVEKRTLEKYEREAKEKNRETWYLSWALDTNLEERDKGKTVEVGRAYFETAQKLFTILDAPGHRSFVPNMIGGACQADLAVLVISARKGEFETGFERGGQTREHAMLAKTAGVKHLIVLINKMDDSTVQWSEERYNECREKLIPYLKKVGFNPNKDIMFMPCSGLNGTNLRDPIAGDFCNWYKGEPFIPYINNLPSLNRNITGPFMMPIVDRYNDRGTIVLGKVESGNCRKGDSLLLMPNKTPVTMDTLWRNDNEVLAVHCGENIKAKLRGVDENDIISGFVICDPSSPCKTGRVFDAKVVIIEHKSIICAGYSAVCHMHSVAEEVTVKLLICLIDKKTDEKSKVRPRFVKQDQIAIMRFETSGVICLEAFRDHPQLGRFTLRDEGKTIAIGKVLKVVE